jgi:hypothetical protein
MPGTKLNFKDPNKLYFGTNNMSTKTKHDSDDFWKKLNFTLSSVAVLILVMLYIHDPNIVTGVSALVGVAIPLYWQYSSDTLKENKGVEGYVKWGRVKFKGVN